MLWGQSWVPGHQPPDVPGGPGRWPLARCATGSHRGRGVNPQLPPGRPHLPMESSAARSTGDSSGFAPSGVSCAVDGDRSSARMTGHAKQMTWVRTRTNFRLWADGRRIERDGEADTGTAPPTWAKGAPRYSWLIYGLRRTRKRDKNGFRACPGQRGPAIVRTCQDTVTGGPQGSQDIETRHEGPVFGSALRSVQNPDRPPPRALIGRPKAIEELEWRCDIRRTGRAARPCNGLTFASRAAGGRVRIGAWATWPYRALPIASQPMISFRPG